MALAASDAWASWRPATCLPDDCFCEALRDSLVRQPANTWSSLAFVAAALWVAARLSRRKRSGEAVLAPAEAALFLGALVLVGLGSAFYHASFTFVGQVFDVSGMYFVATFILLHRLGPRLGLPPIGAILGFVVVNAVLMAGQVTTPGARRIVFGVLLLSALGVEWNAAREGRRWLAAGSGLMGAAFVIWILDRWRLVCAPESLLQGHAAWHVLGALAAACLYRSYEAETAPAATRTGGPR